MRIIPVTLKIANEYVNRNHRHHKACRGCKFCIGLSDNDVLASYAQLHGVAICGRPVSRYLDDKLTLEINRLCTDGSHNACSMLYSACIRAAKAMGYKRVITYTLESEDGASLRASNFRFDGLAGGEIWTGSRERDNGVPRERKKRWIYDICKEAKNE